MGVRILNILKAKATNLPVIPDNETLKDFSRRLEESYFRHIKEDVGYEIESDKELIKRLLALVNLVLEIKSSVFLIPD